MKLQTLRRGTAAGAVIALSLTFAACGSEDDNEATGSDTPSAAENGGDNSGDEATGAQAQTFGAGCAAIPTDPNDAGSFEGMVQDPVATAASNNPVLKTLVAAVSSVDGLVDTLNDQPALTVFAPIDDPAFAAIPKDTLNSLVEGAQKDGMDSDLAKVLANHVLAENDDPAAVVGEKETLAGGTLTIEGDENGMTVSDGTVTANVLCGNIPTANATVYVIDQVLTGILG
ncbi:fasciclin domain-containing protein [Nocardioides sp.]|uniref:fasciclin domain-containing protein n=1 Tax=Nocardioides sp. TaxID=35761 RepID=UPI0035193AA7